MNEQKQKSSKKNNSKPRSFRDTRPYAVVYMFIITFFFTVILVGVSAFTKDRIEANQRIMRERALLTAALPETVNSDTPSMKVNEIYRSQVKEPEDPQTNPLYRVTTAEDKDEVIAYVLPVEGQGFWDRIAGFLALETDRETIIGIAFYAQNETPGLGAEILSEDFRSQFEGKKLASGKIPLEIRSAAAETGKHSVHAITGATQTSNRLEDIITENIAVWRDRETEK